MTIDDCLPWNELKARWRLGDKSLVLVHAGLGRIWVVTWPEQAIHRTLTEEEYQEAEQAGACFVSGRLGRPMTADGYVRFLGMVTLGRKPPLKQP